VATRVGCGGIRLALFNNLSPYPPNRRKDLEDISSRIRIIAILAQMPLPWQPGKVGQNFFGSIQWPNSEKPKIDAKILQISLAEAEL